MLIWPLLSWHRRLEKLKQSITQQVSEIRPSAKKYLRVPSGDDDLGLELGLGGLGGMPAALEYDNDEESYNEMCRV